MLVLELPVQEVGAIDVGVAGDLPPEFVVPEVAMDEGLRSDGRLEGGRHREIHQLGQNRMFGHPRQRVADAGGGIDLIDEDIGGLAHGGVFFDCCEPGIEAGDAQIPEGRSMPVKSTVRLA